MVGRLTVSLVTCAVECLLGCCDFQLGSPCNGAVLEFWSTPLIQEGSSVMFMDMADWKFQTIPHTEKSYGLKNSIWKYTGHCEKQELSIQSLYAIETKSTYFICTSFSRKFFETLQKSRFRTNIYQTKAKDVANNRPLNLDLKLWFWNPAYFIAIWLSWVIGTIHPLNGPDYNGCTWT